MAEIRLQRRVMKVRNSLRSLKKRDKDCRIIRRKFRCCWGGVIVGFECFIILVIQFIFLPIILIIWGILIIRGWVWKFRRRGRFGIKI